MSGTVDSVRLLEEAVMSYVEHLYFQEYNTWKDDHLEGLYRGRKNDGHFDQDERALVYGVVHVCKYGSVRPNTLVFARGQFMIIPYIDITEEPWRR